MAVGSVRGMILGVMASPLLLIVTGGPGSSDGTGAVILVVLPVLGAVLVIAGVVVVKLAVGLITAVFWTVVVVALVVAVLWALKTLVW